MIKNLLLITFRNFRKNWLFVFINIFGMGIAIACCTVAYLNYEFNADFDTQYANARKIYRINMVRELTDNHLRYGMSPLPLGNVIAQNAYDGVTVARYVSRISSLKRGDDLFETRIAFVDRAFLKIFATNGETQRYDIKDPTTIFISATLAGRLFGERQGVGQEITQVFRNGIKTYKVGGIFDDLPLNNSFLYDAVTSMEVLAATGELQQDNWRQYANTFLMIENPSDVGRVNSSLQQYVQNHNGSDLSFKIVGYYLDPLPGLAQRARGDEIQEHSLNYGLSKPAVFVPALMAVLIILIACFNFTNTSIAMAGRRLKEIGIRKAIGGQRKQLVAQFIGENLILAIFALAVGLVMAEFLVPAYNQMWPNIKLVLNFVDNLRILLLFVSLLVAISILSGLYPALYISSFKTVMIFKGKIKFGGTNWFTRTLLVFQYTVSVVAIICGVAFVLNARYQKNLDYGFDMDGSVFAWIENENEFNTYRNALVQHPEIAFVAGAQHHINVWSYRAGLKVNDAHTEVEMLDVGEGYFEAAGISLLSGKGFDRETAMDRSASVIVNEEFAKHYGWTDPIGQQIVLNDTVKLQVAGLVKNYYPLGLWRPLEPVVFRYAAPSSYRQIVVRATTGAQPTTIDRIMREEWQKVFADRVYNGLRMRDRFANSFLDNENIMSIFVFLSVVAGLMSVTGLFSLVSLNVVKKLKEIGVRKIFGAPVMRMMNVVNREFIILLIVSGVLGALLGIQMEGALLSMIWAYHVHVQPVVFILAGSGLIAVSLGIIGFRVYRATLINPIEILKDE